MDVIYCKYEKEFNPQPVYLYLDGEDQTSWINYNGEIGNAISETQFHNRLLALKLPCIGYSNDEEKEFLEENEELINKLLESYESEWDGSNWKGEWDEKLVEELQAVCDDFESRISFGDAWDLLDSTDKQELKNDLKTKTLKEVAKTLKEDCWSNDVYIDNVYDFLEDLQKEIEEEEEEEED